MVARTSVAGVFLLVSACITPPAFERAEESEPSGAAVGVLDDMVLVPAVAIAGAPLTPSHHGKQHKKGKCDDDCDEDDASKGGASKGGAPNGGARNGGASNGDAPKGDAPNGDAPPPADAEADPSVAVPSFWIDAREVSVRAYGDCVGAGVCSAAGSGAGCTGPSGLGEHPITCVARAQASTYCEWRHKRLVRNAEWTAAAAGAGERPFPWGSEPPSEHRLNACGAECARAGMYPGPDPFRSTAPCGSFPDGRSPEGVLDLAGNVAEWVDDAAGVVRGGGWADVEPTKVASTSSRAVAPETAEPTVGFRCARDP